MKQPPRTHLLLRMATPLRVILTVEPVGFWLRRRSCWSFIA
ncbi:hypothetical protein [Dyella sp.]